MDEKTTTAHPLGKQGVKTSKPKIEARKMIQCISETKLTQYELAAA